MHEHRLALSDDILHGAGAIAEHLFGASAARRRVYYLVESGQLPHFRVGRARICARRSTLARWISEQELQLSK
jgi:hypothetical protein